MLAAALALSAHAVPTCPVTGLGPSPDCYGGTVLTTPPTATPPAGLCPCQCSDGYSAETPASSSAACTAALCTSALGSLCTGSKTFQALPLQYTTWSSYVYNKYVDRPQSLSSPAGSYCANYTFSCTPTNIAGGKCNSWDAGSVATVYTWLPSGTCSQYVSSYGDFFACNTTNCNAPPPPSGRSSLAVHTTPAGATAAFAVAAVAVLALW